MVRGAWQQQPPKLKMYQVMLSKVLGLWIGTAPSSNVSSIHRTADLNNLRPVVYRVFCICDCVMSRARYSSEQNAGDILWSLADSLTDYGCECKGHEQLGLTQSASNNNNNNYYNIYGAAVMAQIHCKSSPGSFDESRLSAGLPPTDLGCEFCR